MLPHARQRHPSRFNRAARVPQSSRNSTQAPAIHNLRLGISDPPAPFPFMRLPREMRDMIWEHTLHSRLVMPKKVGKVYSPGPPLIARVCRESRQVALRCGSPRSFDSIRKRGSTAWFDPSRDVVLWSRAAPNLMGNKICPMLWRGLTSLSITRAQLKELEVRNRTIFADEHVASLRLINVLYHSGYEVLVWAPEIANYVLGGNSVVLVDLDNEDEVKWYRRKLNANLITRDCQRTLERCFRELSTDPAVWTGAVQKLRTQWLNFQCRGDPLAPGPPKHGDETWDEASAWAKNRLKKMPRVRPVFMIHKALEDKIATKTRNRGTAYPQVYFDDGEWWAR